MLTWFLNILLTLILWQSEGAGLSGPALMAKLPIINFNTQAEELRVTADKVFVSSLDNRTVFYDQKADLIQPIASITKLMTALVFLDHNPGWDKTYKITKEDNIEGGRLHLFLGEELTIRDLFATSLIASDNGATQALVHATGLSQAEFMAAMNAKAQEMSLTNTFFIDPIGLSDNNLSTAREVARLAQVAFSNSDILELVKLKEHRFQTLNGREKLIESTNYLLFTEEGNNFEILGAKTGYTDAAGYCFVGRFKNSDGREIISVVLNSDGKNERFIESRNLINWVFKNFTWPKSL